MTHDVILPAECGSHERGLARLRVREVDVCALRHRFVDLCHLLELRVVARTMQQDVGLVGLITGSSACRGCEQHRHKANE